MRVTWGSRETTFSVVKNTTLQRRGSLFGAALAAALAGAAIAFVLGEAAVARSAAPGACAPWPGEPSPLPRPDDPDPVRARWAALRTAELRYRAQALEASAPLEAHRLWQRLLCFERASLELRDALDRSQPIRMHRLVLAEPGDTEYELAADPWESLGRPLAMAPPRPSKPKRTARRRIARPKPAKPEPSDALPILVTEIDYRLGRAGQDLNAARFEEALGSAQVARRLLGTTGSSPELVQRWLRLEVLEATVLVALGREDEARACAVRALARDPKLMLDERRTSPKVVSVFRAVGAQGSAGP